MTRIITRVYNVDYFNVLCNQGIHPVLARIYAARTLFKIKDLSNTLIDLHVPSGLLHMSEAVIYLANAIAAQKKMVIVADYDCDGATACAVGLRGLRSLGAKIDYIVPNRFEYGYGLTPKIVELTVNQKSPDIIITVDNGITSFSGILAAKSHGIDVIITDHHLPGKVLPDAHIIINPNQPACHFPSKNLAGVGVIFYILIALRTELRNRKIFDIHTQPKLDSLLDLVALGTIADLVELDANNRILVTQGLKRIRAGLMHTGIAALFRSAGRKTYCATVLDLGFTIGPRLNAAGRLADMSLGVECLITDDANKAWAIAQKLDTINRRRHDIEMQMQKTALNLLDDFNIHKKRTISLFDASWHQGVIGILASRLKDKFYRPTIAFASSDNNLIKGSGRSIPNFHLRDVLNLISKRIPSVIIEFGGHAMAVGLTIHSNNFDIFTRTFETIGYEQLTENQLEYVIETDGMLEETYYTVKFSHFINEQVWGQGFPLPLFFDYFKVLTQQILKEKHLKLLLEKNGQYYDAIWYKHTSLLSKYVTVIFQLDTNEYSHVTKLLLKIKYAEPMR